MSNGFLLIHVLQALIQKFLDSALAGLEQTSPSPSHEFDSLRQRRQWSDADFLRRYEGPLQTSPRLKACLPYQGRRQGGLIFPCKSCNHCSNMFARNEQKASLNLISPQRCANLSRDESTRAMTANLLPPSLNRTRRFPASGFRGALLREAFTQVDEPNADSLTEASGHREAKNILFPCSVPA